MSKRLYTLVEISLLATLISISGAIKIPTFILGSEFQMSAPPCRKHLCSLRF